MEEKYNPSEIEALQKKRQQIRAQRRRAQMRKRQQMRLLVIALAAVLVLVLTLALVLSLRDEPDTPDVPGNTEPFGTAGTTGQTDPPGTGGTTAPAEGPVELTVTSPVRTRYATTDSTVVISGSSDLEEILLINGKAVSRDEAGRFSVTEELTPGDNVFTVVHKGRTLTYTVTKLAVTLSCQPEAADTFCSEEPVLFTVVAQKGSHVTALFAGKLTELSLCEDQIGSGVPEGYAVYTGQQTLPSCDTDQDMGAITYTITCNGATDRVISENMHCRRRVPILESDPGVTPVGDTYIDVGSGFIAEVVSLTAETFDGRTEDDNSSPLNNYLPKGTVDYASTQLVHNAKADQTYRVLRCGRRVYEAKRNYPAEHRDPIIICYNGTLPDHNEVGFAGFTETEDFAVLTMDTMWKAPFYFHMTPQTYTNPDSRDFTISQLTVTHLEITFCYATSFTGTVEVPADHPLFSGAEVVKNASDYTLRLELKKMGGFYGWDAYYNAQGQLCFQFLKPAKVTPAQNAYGADLSGVTVMLDVGHGGVDSGTMGYVADKAYSESGRNLALAQAVARELESIGAKVVCNRVGNEPVTIEERLAYLKLTGPDLCIAIHHNASDAAGANGMEVYYYGPMSQLAAKNLWAAHRGSGVYRSATIGWHFYHLARQSNCPVVLTENGYMSNGEDMAKTVDAEAIAQKAKLMTQGVVNYFLEINQ